MSLNMKYWRAIFTPKLKTLIYELSSVKHNFYPATIKIDNGAVAMRKYFMWYEWKQHLHQKKKMT